MPALVLMFKGCFRSVAVMFAVSLGAALALPATAGENAATDPGTLFVRAAKEGAIGTARKTKPVDARPAKAGEVIVTVIKGEGTETRSKPAVAGDMVVRNRCPATGNEQYLVTAAKFKERYGDPLGPADPEGWRPYRPHGAEMLYVVVRPTDGSFTFTAPWGEAMVARPGDALVRDPADPKDTYRVAAASFACTYDIIKPAK
jgi:hypothetical protein